MDKIVFIKKGQPSTTSRLVARHFGKEHKDVLRTIKALECSDEFSQRNFAPAPYTHPQNGQRFTEYYITRDGFVFLVMGFTGKSAARFKEDYINAFNKMGRRLSEPKSAEDLMVSQAIALRDQKRKMLELEERVEVVEAKSKTRVEDYFTVAGYAAKIRKPVSLAEAGNLGRTATRICNEEGVTIDKLHDPRFGYVGSYPEEVLKRLF